MPMIEARFRVVRDQFELNAELMIPARGVTALYGPSGCGKTTLLRAIAGLEQHRDGYLKVGNMIWQDTAQFVPPHQRAIGYVFQEASLFNHLKVQRNVEYGYQRVPQDERKISVEHAVELLGIGHLLTRSSDTLSGGERQRVAIARALAANPQLLLMDEPLASLDQNSRQEILPYLESLHRELAIPLIYVSHAADEVARLADHLVLLEVGRVVVTGPIDEMLTRLDLSFAHGNDAEAIIEATIAEHDDQYGLTYLDFVGGRFSVPQRALPIGSCVRVRIAARDVSLTLEQQRDTSILNIFPATVDEVIPDGDAQMMVRLTAGSVPLLARVTRKSAALLDLKPGREVYAQAKSVALLD